MLLHIDYSDINEMAKKFHSKFNHFKSLVAFIDFVHIIKFS